MANTANIKNPTALIETLAQQHPLAAVATIMGQGWTPEAINAMSDDHKREVCGAIQDAVEARWGHRSVTTLAVAKSQVEAYGLEPTEVITPDGEAMMVPAAAAALWHKVGIWRPLTFEHNREGTRKGNRKSLPDQQRDWIEAIRRAGNALKVTIEPEATIEPPVIEVKPPVEVKPVDATAEFAHLLKVTPAALRRDVKQLKQWAQGIRLWQRTHKKQDGWGYRQVKKGIALLAVGYPLEGVKDNFLIDFDAEARRHHGVTEFDTVAWGRSIAAPGESGLKAAIRRLSTAPGCNVSTVGAAGIGKTHTTTEILTEEFDHYVVVSCNPKTAGADFYGFLTPGMENERPNGDITKGFRLSSFAEALLMAEQGKRVGILLDELDAIESGASLALNRALEQRAMEHRYMGREINFGHNVVFFGAQNTVGNGATAQFGAREKSDGAFQDRWVRIRVKWEEATEATIADEMLAAFGA